MRINKQWRSSKVSQVSSVMKGVPIIFLKRSKRPFFPLLLLFSPYSFIAMEGKWTSFLSLLSPLLSVLYQTTTPLVLCSPSAVEGIHVLSVFLDSVVERTPERTVGGSLFLPPPPVSPPNCTTFSLLPSKFVSAAIRVFGAFFFLGSLWCASSLPYFLGTHRRLAAEAELRRKREKKARDNLSEDISDSHLRTW